MYTAKRATSVSYTMIRLATQTNDVDRRCRRRKIHPSKGVGIPRSRLEFACKRFTTGSGRRNRSFVKHDRRPIHSDAVGHSVKRGIPGVTHRVHRRPDGDEVSSIYKCGSTWLRSRLVSSLLRVRSETGSAYWSLRVYCGLRWIPREGDRLIEITAGR